MYLLDDKNVTLVENMKAAIYCVICKDEVKLMWIFFVFRVLIPKNTPP
jgi:hypothetical protein